jgi:hypothetical protein
MSCSIREPDMAGLIPHHRAQSTFAVNKFFGSIPSIVFFGTIFADISHHYAA